MASAVGSVGLGASLAGGLMSAFGAASSGNAQKQMYDYQSQVATLNASIDKQNAEYASNQGEIQASQYGQKAAQQRGQIIAAQGASGIQVGTGSNAAVVQSQKAITDLDLTQIRSNAAKTAYDFTTKAAADTTQANLDTIAGSNAQKAGYIGAASSILGTVGSVSSKWLQGNTTGLWGGSSGSGGSISLYGPQQTVVGTA